MSQPWTAMEEEVLRTEWATGKRFSDIAETLQRSVFSVMRRRAKLGLDSRETTHTERGTRRRYPLELVAELGQLRDSGMSVQAIAASKGLPHGAVGYLLKRRRTDGKPRKLRTWTEEEGRVLSEMFLSGGTVHEIGARIGRSAYAVKERCRIRGLMDSAPNRKAQVRIAGNSSPSLQNALRQKLTTALSRRSGEKHDVTVSYLLDLHKRQNGLCFYTRLPLSTTWNHPCTLSIDRVDSSKGYVVGNVVLCIAAVNYMKTDLPLDQFFQHCRLIVQNESLIREELDHSRSLCPAPSG